MSALASIDFQALGKVIAASIGGTTLVVTTFCLCLYGADAYRVRRRDGQTARALPYAVVAGISGLTFVAAVILGLIVMTTK